MMTIIPVCASPNKSHFHFSPAQLFTYKLNYRPDPGMGTNKYLKCESFVACINKQLLPGVIRDLRYENWRIYLARDLAPAQGMGLVSFELREFLKLI